MLRPELTPIDSGDKPEKPKPEDLTNSPFRDFGNPPPPPSPPSSQPPPPPPGGDQPSQSVHDHGDQPGLKSSGQSSSSKSDEQGSKGSSQAEDTDDADRGKDETGAKDELPDFEEAEENRIDPADILKFYLAAQHNPVLREIRFLTEHEGIPVMLQGNIDACLRLCADYGIDEENDAEARDYLEHITNGGSYEKHKDDPVNAAWVKAHEAYDPALGDKNNDKAEIVEYRRQIETAYGVTFSSVEGADDWDLLRVRMVHVGMEMAAAALGERARQMGLDWDNATAFRRIIGEIDIHLSRDTSEEGALAQVENRRIKIFWVERDDGDRNAYLVPDVLLHELGHIFNANAGLGDREGQGSINKTKEHPNTWKGMGSPYPATLARENKPDRSVKFESWMEDIRPLHDILGLRAGDKLFSGVTLTKDQILLLRHSWAKGDTNEITADGFLNWVFHRNTDGAIGFTDSAEGKKWQAFMNDSMEVWIRNAVVYNALRENSNIPFFVEHGMLPNFAGFTTLAESDVNVRTEPSTAKGDETVVRSLAKGEEVAVIGQTKGGFNGRDNSWTAIIWNGRKLWVASYLLVPTQNVPTPVREDDSHFDFDPSGSGEEEWEFFFRLASYLDQGVVNVQ